MLLILSSIETQAIRAQSAGKLSHRCATIPTFRTAADARAWAEHAEHAGDYSDAAEAYMTEADIYDRKGDSNAAEVERRKARRLATDVVFDVISTNPPTRRGWPNGSRPAAVT